MLSFQSIGRLQQQGSSRLATRRANSRQFGLKLMMLLLLLVFSKAWSLQMYFPVTKDLLPRESVFLGKVGKNHTILIITEAGPTTDPYTKVESTCDIERYVCSDRCWIYIKAPDTVGEKNCEVTLKGSQSMFSFGFSYLVSPDTLVLGLTKDEPVRLSAGKSGSIELYLANLSAGYTKVEIGCDACGWTTLSLEPMWGGKVSIPILLRIPGDKEISITAQDLESGEKESVQVSVQVNQTLENLLSTPAWSFLSTDPISLLARSLWGWLIVPS